RVWAAIELDDVLSVAHLGRAGRYDQVLITDGRADVGRRQALCVQGVRVEAHHDLALPASPGLWHTRALDRAELLVDEVLGVVEDLLLAQSVAADGNLHDRHAGGA